MKKYTIKDEMFYSTLHLFVGKHKELEDYIKKEYDCEITDEGNGGENFYLQNKEKKEVRCVWLDEFKNNTGSQATLLHELLHFTFDVLRDRGLKYSDDSEETYTYFLENMYIKCINAMTNKQKDQMMRIAERKAKSKKRIKK